MEKEEVPGIRLAKSTTLLMLGFTRVAKLTNIEKRQTDIFSFNDNISICSTGIDN
jgi:hypothetical protein